MACSSMTLELKLTNVPTNFLSFQLDLLNIMMSWCPTTNITRTTNYGIQIPKLLTLRSKYHDLINDHVQSASSQPESYLLFKKNMIA